MRCLNSILMKDLIKGLLIVLGSAIGVTCVALLAYMFKIHPLWSMLGIAALCTIIFKIHMKWK